MDSTYWMEKAIKKFFIINEVLSSY